MKESEPTSQEFVSIKRIARRLGTTEYVVFKACREIDMPVFIIGDIRNEHFLREVDEIKEKYARNGRASAKNRTPQQRHELALKAGHAAAVKRLSLKGK